MKPHRSFARRFFNFLIVAFILYSVVGFVVLPTVLKSQAIKRLSVELGRPVRLTQIRVNPWVLSVTIEGLAISEPNSADFVSWDRVYANFDAASFIASEWRFQEITAAAPAISIVVNKDGTLNFSDLLAKFSKPAEPPGKPAWPLRIGKLVVSGAQLDFVDHSRAEEFKTHVGPVNFSLVQFHTAPNRDAPYEFTASTESGEKLRWLGTVSVSPLASEGEFVINGLSLPKYAPYYHDFVQFDVLSGLLDLTGRYKAGLAGKEPQAQLLAGRVRLIDFKAAARRSKDPVIELDDLEVSGIEADAAALTAKVAKVGLIGGRAALHRAKDGTIDLLAMIAPVAAAPAVTSPPVVGAASSKPATLQLEVDALSIRQFSASFEDMVPERATTQKIENAEIDVQKFTLTEGASIPVRASLTLPNRGAITADGAVVLTPLQATLAVALSNVSLATISPYIEPMLNVRITQGLLTAKGNARASLPAGAPPEITYVGDVKIDRFGLVDGIANEPLAGWTQLALNGIDFASSPLAMAVKEIVWDEPSAHVLINRDHSINLASLARESKAAAAEPATVSLPSQPTNSTAARGPKIEVGQVVIKEGAFTFTDRSIQPEVNMAVNHFSGTIAGLSSENPGRGDVTMRATIDGGGPITITGKLDPLGPKKSIDLRVELKDMELTPFSPYTGKFAGYELSRGKLFLDVSARLLDRKLDMSNAVTLTQFTLGAPTQSPDATKLPVRLAIALLKDTDGKIALDVPVQGSLDDPQFKISGVILHVIGNLLTKAAVSPFSLLGAMFGGGGDELAFQDFAPGEAQLQPGNLPKLETLKKGLQARPALNLEIAGGFDQAADGRALKERRLAKMLRSAIWDERRKVDPSVPPPEQLVVTPEEEQAMIHTLYAQKFPLGTTYTPSIQSAPPPRLPADTAAAPEKKGIFRRATDVVTLKSLRDRLFDGKEKSAPAPAPTALPPSDSSAQMAATAGSEPSTEEMKARLMDVVDVSDGDLRRLAAARAQLVRDYFVQQQINPERLFLANVPNESKGPRVYLQLQ